MLLRANQWICVVSLTAILLCRYVVQHYIHQSPLPSPPLLQFGGGQSKPEFTVELRGGVVEWASKDKSSKKHVLEVSAQPSRPGDSCSSIWGNVCVCVV